jgi:hypothetical protein
MHNNVRKLQSLSCVAAVQQRTKQLASCVQYAPADHAAAPVIAGCCVVWTHSAV